MAVRDMSEHECLRCLSTERFGHLVCVRDGLPYMVPVNYAYGREKLYVFSLPGQKIDWLRNNPNACFQVGEMRDNQYWRSVLVRGMYNELPDNDRHRAERMHAWDLLQERRIWWEPGGFEPDSASEDATATIFFGITVNDVTGRQFF